MSENTKKLYEKFKQEYVKSGYLYSGCLPYDVKNKESFTELKNKGLIQVRNCENFCYELTKAERIKLIKEHNLKEVWETEHACFMVEGSFEELRSLELTI